MNFKVFQYRLPISGELEDLNQYLAAHKIASATHHIVPCNGASMLVVVVETVGTPAPKSEGGAEKKGYANPPLVDYREILTDEQFAVFSQLRDARKERAEELGLEVFTLFSNAQLAEMVTAKTVTEAKLGKIAGIGKGRMEKYSSVVLPILQRAFPEEVEKESKTGSKGGRAG